MSLEHHRSEAPELLRFAVITFSDTREAATDRGGDDLVEAIERAGHSVTHRSIHPDEPARIALAVKKAAHLEEVDLVITTGGTGIAPRDSTYDTLREVLESEIPGFGELFRWLSYREIGSAAMLSRAIGGLLGGKVVLALPGSPKALRLAMEEMVLKEAGHLVGQARGPRPAGGARLRPGRARHS